MKKVVVYCCLGLAAVVAAGALGAYCLRDGVSAEELARSDDPQERAVAAERLGASGSEAERILRKLANDPDDWVAVKAIRSLGRQRDDERQNLLARMVYDKSLSARGRGEAAAVLGIFPQTDPKVLTVPLRTDPDAKVRRGAARGLLKLQKPDTLEELVAALEDPDPAVRGYANAAIHGMIVKFFPFDPQKPPSSQRQTIERIKNYLRECGILNDAPAP